MKCPKLTKPPPEKKPAVEVTRLKEWFAAVFAKNKCDWTKEEPKEYEGAGECPLPEP
jgi:hypothetical protein